MQLETIRNLLQNVSDIIWKLASAERVLVVSFSDSSFTVEVSSGLPLEKGQNVENLYHVHKENSANGKSLFLLSLPGEPRSLGFLFVEAGQFTEEVNPGFHSIISHLTTLLSKLQQAKLETQKEDTLVAKLNKIKESQDADYFLISLLLDALQSERNIVESISTEYFLSQKKKFQFRQWEGEIGGDICKTDTIYLNDGHAYTVFFNGDAMGKSVQGAGGAIVLGVVFDAVVSRAKLRRRRNYNLYPEIWLKEVFLDIHNVFESFQGTMFASFMLGIIHPETNIMYYINAEHPYTILYRAGKASFLESQKHMFKVGFPEQHENLSIRLFTLEEGDVVITGSDGKDDVIIGEDETGIEIVSDDEFQIIHIVEEEKGDLQKIYEGVGKKGKLKDDFSLVKVSYRAKYTPRTQSLAIQKKIDASIVECKQHLEKENLDVLLQTLYSLEVFVEEVPSIAKLLAKIYYNDGDILQSIEYFERYTESNPTDNLFIESRTYLVLLEILIKYYDLRQEYDKAIECAEEYLYINPASNDMLSMLSILYKSQSKLSRAADTGERLYLREPENLENLLHLAEVYLKLKVSDRASKIIRKAEELAPDNTRIQEMLDKLEKL
ncbi:MAG: SpoIIE family protein phosphatase [Spirochaetota bacterium]